METRLFTSLWKEKEESEVSELIRRPEGPLSVARAHTRGIRHNVTMVNSDGGREL